MDKVLVGILTLNNPGRLRECLDSIYATHDMYENNQYRENITVIVLDDCSDPENQKKNQEICSERRIDLLIHENRAGVPRGWNNLTTYKNSDYCIILNDDIILVHNWLNCIVYTLKNNLNIGVVGLNAYEGENFHLPSNNIPTYVESKIMLGNKRKPLLSARGYAFGFRKADYLAIGGFDQRYFCFFEEVDFNLTLTQQLGKRNCILSYPIIKHVHGDTLLKVSNHNQIFLESKAKFEEKWQVKWENLRELFNCDTVPNINKDTLDEWNSNINIWS